MFRSRLTVLLTVPLLLVVPAASAQTDPGELPPQTSDGRPGQVAAAVPLSRLTAGRRVTTDETWQVVPGLNHRHWSWVDARGPVSAYLLTANLRTPGLALDHLSKPRVADRGPLLGLLRHGGAIAGVNGDFFDIGDTGAPLGVGVARGTGLRHGPRAGWNLSFRLGPRGGKTIGPTPVHAQWVQRPRLAVRAVNTPVVPVSGIGLYTRRWGTMPGARVLDGARPRDMRQVVVEGGRVVSNTRQVVEGAPITGQVLLGRGEGARALASIPVGSRATFRTWVAGDPVVVISGNDVLLRNGRRAVADDTVMHPRTALGIDSDTGRLLLLVVDGRSETSRGLTMVETARLLRQLGAEEALNLDGGGSSTMAALRPESGVVEVLNQPSDGTQRRIPNGLGFTWAS